MLHPLNVRPLELLFTSTTGTVRAWLESRILLLLSCPLSDRMFDTSFLQVLVFGVVGALLVGPKDLPMAARKFGGMLGKGVGLISRTRNSVQSFIRENQLTNVQQDFERSLQQIRQVQDEVKQGLTSPIVSAQPTTRYTHTEYPSFSDSVRVHSFPGPSGTGYSDNRVDSRTPLSEIPQSPYALYVLVCRLKHNF